MHDNGIKRIKYSKDLKVVFSLDERSNVIKIYDGIFIGESTSATVKIKLHRMKNF